MVNGVVKGKAEADSKQAIIAVSGENGIIRVIFRK